MPAINTNIWKWLVMKNINLNIAKKHILAIAAALTVVYLLWPKSNFNEDLLNVENIYQHIEVLSSDEYQGRQAGSEGDRKALEYIEDYFGDIGLMPAGIDNTYYQPFKTVMPDIDTAPIFTVSSTDGEIVFDLDIFEDYNVIPSLSGGSIDYYGDLVIAGSDLLRLEPEVIEGRVVIIEANRLLPKHVSFVKESGGKGILCTTGVNVYDRNRRVELLKPLSIAGKAGESIFAGYFSYESYFNMIKMIEDGSIGVDGGLYDVMERARIKVDISFPIVESANILGKVEGKSENGEILLITADIDGCGVGSDGKYFPGAFNNTSGIAALLEVARVISEQDSLPYQTIVFAGWNGQQQQLWGSSHYIDDPIYPLNKTTVIHLGAVGRQTIEGLKVSTDMLHGTILKDRIINYALDSGQKVVPGSMGYGSITRFNDKMVSAVSLYDSNEILNTYGDSSEKIDKDSLENAAGTVLSFVKRDIYKDRGFDYLTSTDKLVLSIFVFLGLLSYLIVIAYNAYPNVKLFGHTIESIYYSTLSILVRKLYTALVFIIIAVFILSLLGNIDPGTDAKLIGDEFQTNLSPYLTVKRSVLFIKSMFNPSIYGENTSGSIIDLIYSSSRQSLILISAALFLSTILGIARGMYESYRSKKSGLTTLGSLIFFSIPDVLIVLLTLMGYSFLSRKIPEIKEAEFIKELVLPLLTLAIIPTVYISRITFITVQEELGKDYVRNALAKGFSRKKTLFKEIMPAVAFKIVDAMPSIMTMLLTNMIVVEWLFYYQGILYYLLYFYKRQEVYSFVPLAMTLGLIYLTFTKGIQILSRLINPLKKRRV